MVLKHDAEDGICERFRRQHSPCPSEASNLAPSLVSPPPPWAWPAIKATKADMKQEIWFSEQLPSLRRGEHRGELRYLVTFGSLGKVKGGIDFGGELLAEGWQLEGSWLSQAVTRLQLQQGRLGWDLVEVSDETSQRWN